MLSRNIMYYGQDTPLPERIPLRAGPLSLIYEAGDLRYIRLNDREIIRRVYVAVRDHNWGTVPPQTTNFRLESTADTFQIRYDVENKQNAIDFIWHAEISGDKSGKITFTMSGKARSTFRRNRIGFCVLHPIPECAGRPCTITSIDGSKIVTHFPDTILAGSPFQNVRAITHEVVPGVHATVTLEGDTFETEDQRNWIDASFKTYCTPLRLPFPVEIPHGTVVHQAVTLTLYGQLNSFAPTAARAPVITLAETPTSQPVQRLARIGLGAASHGQRLSERELARLRDLHLSHIRLDLTPSLPGWKDRLTQISREAAEMGAGLEIALFLSDTAEAELNAVRASLNVIRPRIVFWLIFRIGEKTTTERWVALSRQILHDYSPLVPIGSGTNAYFNELNANRPMSETLAKSDLISYSINPQVHAFDNASLAETLEAIPATVSSTRTLVGNHSIAVSPVVLRPRFNVVATGPEPDPLPDELPFPVDVRQMSLFGAAWTVGAIKALAENGVASMTLFETAGWRGVMNTEAGSPLPDKFRAPPGTVFPMYHVIADITEFSDGQVIPMRSSQPLLITSLRLITKNRLRTVIANLSPQRQCVRIQQPGEYLNSFQLDETNAMQAMTDPESFRLRQGTKLINAPGGVEITLAAYAIVRVDSIDTYTENQ